MTSSTASKPDNTYARVSLFLCVSMTSPSTLDPIAGRRGSHRVENPGESMAILVHRYGPQIGEVGDRNYDPSRGYVRDRRKITSRSGA